jgi:hypothetical protein
MANMQQEICMGRLGSRAMARVRAKFGLDASAHNQPPLARGITETPETKTHGDMGPGYSKGPTGH